MSAKIPKLVPEQLSSEKLIEIDPLPPHDFVLVDSLQYKMSDYMKFTGPKWTDKEQLGDAIVRYMDDSLQWIPTQNPGNPKAGLGSGLNHYGVTAIDSQGARQAERIFSAWVELFRSAPERILIRSSWLLDGKDGMLKERYCEIQRNEVVEQLRRILGQLQKVKEGGFFLLHCGI